MKRISFWTCWSLLILSGWANAAVSQPLNQSEHVDETCWTRALTQTAMNDCERHEVEAADFEMNQIYEKVLHRYASHPLEIKKFKAAQRAWLTFRDAEMTARYPAENPLHGYGSIWPLCFGSYRLKLTGARIAQLKHYLDGSQDGDQCGPPLPASESTD